MIDWRSFIRKFVLAHIVFFLVAYFLLNCFILAVMVESFVRTSGNDIAFAFNTILILLSMYFIGWSSIEIWRFYPEVMKQ